MKITLLHYTFGPVVGGVETVMEAHARLFAAHGHDVTVVCGEGVAGSNPAIKVTLVPEMRRDHPLAIATQGELDTGAPGPNFVGLKNRLVEKLAPVLESQDVVFLHNVLTMHFHLALTVALWDLARRPGEPRFVAWVHDLAACNPDYPFPHIEREPWKLLTQRHPSVDYVAVSEHRSKQFTGLTGALLETCDVIPNGIDPISQLGLTENVAKLALERGILEMDMVLLHPARILKRKNIELSMRVTAELKTAGKSCCCMVTGAPDHHNPATAAYHDSLLKLRAELGIAGDFIFLHELFTVTNADLIGLYRVADVLFFPSKQEGFGLPLLEGGLHGIPIFCADIEPMKSLARGNITFFSLSTEPAALAQMIATCVAESPAIQARKAIVREYNWETIYKKMTKFE